MQSVSLRNRVNTGKTMRAAPPGATRTAPLERSTGLTAQIQRGHLRMLGTFLTQVAGQISALLDSIGTLVSGLL